MVAFPGAPRAYAQSQEPAVEAPPGIGPDERPEEERLAEVEDGIEDEAWTFRFLVPTALVISVLIVIATIIVYAVRVKARYRVAK